MSKFLNERRLRDYPRLFLVTMAVVLLGNVVFRDGWLGASGQLIGTDFVMLYSGGSLLRQSPRQLYDFDAQHQVQQALVQPTELWGLLPYNYPPYVAFVIQPLTRIPLGWAYALWTLAAVLLGILAAWLVHKYLIPKSLHERGLTAVQIAILSLSFFPFMEGLLVGQNHALTLVLTTGILAAMLKDRWVLAGALAGLSIYKPQFALGFLIIWLVWGKWRSLLAYGITAGVWIGAALLALGSGVFQSYLQSMPLLLKMLYVEGFGTYLEVTPYGLLVTLLPASAWAGIVVATQVLTGLLAIGLGIYSWQVRKSPMGTRVPVMALAVLFPLLAAPHTLLHDLVVLVPVFAVWARWQPRRSLLYLCIVVYLAAFLLPWAANLSGIAILAVVPIFLTGMLVKWGLETGNGKRLMA